MHQTPEQVAKELELTKISQRALLHEVRRLRKLAKSRLVRLKAAVRKLHHQEWTK